MNTINIPVGTSNFAEIRRKGSYFINKPSLIEQLLKTQSTKARIRAAYGIALPKTRNSDH